MQGDEGDVGLIPGLGGSPWKMKWKPTPVFLPEEFHGQRNLAGYSPQGCKESDMTEPTYTTGILGVQRTSL